jgi:thiol-disulfide isomerase/thioredoxin
MKLKKTRSLILALIPLCFFPLLLHHSPSLAKCPEIIEGFKLRDLKGNSATLSCKSYEVIIINFWATWCPPCRAEIPELRQIYKEYKSRGVEIAGIALQVITPKEIRSFVKSNKINYPIFLGEAKDLNAQNSIISIPVTFIIDNQGKTYRKLIGYHTKDELEQMIKELLMKR